MPQPLDAYDRLYNQWRADQETIAQMGNALDAERAARKRAQLTLRELETRLPAGYESLAWEELKEIRAIIARGLGEHAA